MSERKSAMKPPREPKRWRYPRLYASFDKRTDRLYGMRIIYPNGRGDYSKGYESWRWERWKDSPDFNFACWASVPQRSWCHDYIPIDAPPNDEAANQSRTAMLEYVRRTEGVGPVYLGEIK